jgi:hypothetical protein
MSAVTGKNAKHPNRTGQRCIICYAWEIQAKPKTAHNREKLLIEHETYCPDYQQTIR